MNGLAVLLLEAFKSSIGQQLEEQGEVNPRLLAEAVRWLRDSGIELRSEAAPVTDLSGLVKSLNFLYDDEGDEAEVKQVENF